MINIFVDFLYVVRRRQHTLKLIFNLLIINLRMQLVLVSSLYCKEYCRDLNVLYLKQKMSAPSSKVLRSDYINTW